MSDEVLTDEFFEEARERLKTRLKPKRYEHSLSVAHMAVVLARAYGVDERRARIAGLLHDWDKNYKDFEIRARARELGVNVSDEIIEDMPQLLHGPTAARALAREYPALDADILQAIDRHTSAAVGMSDLDMVIFTADAIEPLRPFTDMAGIRAAIGKVSLERLFFETLRHVMLFLTSRGKTMHPDTLSVWNHYARRLDQAGEDLTVILANDLVPARGKEAGTKPAKEKRKERK